MNKYYLIFFELLGNLLIETLEKVDTTIVSNSFSITTKSNIIKTTSNKEMIAYSKILNYYINNIFIKNVNMKEIKRNIWT